MNKKRFRHYVLWAMGAWNISTDGYNWYRTGARTRRRAKKLATRVWRYA